MNLPDCHARTRLVAFYLPQYHPTPENDLWWGKGFTEWTNVTRAHPLFPGHYQPHLPSDLGFYDLRVRETRHDQIRLAKSHGIDAFCFHYYWFSGKRLLHAPLDDFLADPDSDMTFCLCWANESWTRTWSGGRGERLITQQYLPGDEEKFIRDLLPFLRDPRYLRFNGAPLIVVYAPQDMPDARGSIGKWRQCCEQEGVGPIHVAAALTYDNQEYLRYGCDSAVEFPPHCAGVRPSPEGMNFYEPFQGQTVQYSEVAESFLRRDHSKANVFRTVFPSWDNTARKGSRAYIVLNGTPDNYEYWLSESIRKTCHEHPDSDRLVFINAWNEWAEGCHLEPDQQYQRSFLEATWRARLSRSVLTGCMDRTSPHTSADRRRSLFGDLRNVLQYHSTGLARNLANATKTALRRHPGMAKLARKILRFVK